jgi:hypothetical protein
MDDHQKCKSRSLVFHEIWEYSIVQYSTVSVKVRVFPSLSSPLSSLSTPCNLKLEQSLIAENQLVMNMDDYLSWWWWWMKVGTQLYISDICDKSSSWQNFDWSPYRTREGFLAIVGELNCFVCLCYWSRHHNDASPLFSPILSFQHTDLHKHISAN